MFQNKLQDFFNTASIMDLSKTMNPLTQVNEYMNSSLKFFEETSKLTNTLFFNPMDSSNIMSFFEKTNKMILSSCSDYMGIMGLVSKETYEELIDKYNKIQKELEKQKAQISQKDKKLKTDDKKIKTLEKDIKDFQEKIKKLETELAAEKIDKATSSNKK